MNNNINIFLENGDNIVLTQKEYLASGGEGTVYQKGQYAYKIMHDQHRIIDKKKIEELNKISCKNVLNPIAHIYDSKGLPIGFLMKYIRNTEFLCKLFNIGFRQKNNFSNNDMVDLIKNLQLTLQKCHDVNVLAVDFNQMNFLVDNATYKVPYFIDVDSYQTKSFKATAIMDSIRDRSIKNNEFNIYSDWYSWGIVTFWLYIGTHPYRGSHPLYAKNDWCGKRMEDFVSLFHKDVSMPANCFDFSVIPKPHLEWYKEVFETKNRSVPPLPEGMVIIPVKIAVPVITNFISEKVFEYAQQIIDVKSNHNDIFVLTQDHLCKNGISIFYDKYKNNKKIISADDKDVFLVSYENNILHIYNFRNTFEKDIECDDYLIEDGKILTKHGGKLYRHQIEYIEERIIHSVKELCHVFESSCKMFDNVLFQDMFGQMFINFSDESGNFINKEINELKYHTIIEAKRIKNICVVISHKINKFYRSVIAFSPHSFNYVIRQEETDIDSTCDFVMKSNGMCIGINGDSFEAWAGDKINKFASNPIPKNGFLFLINDKLHFFSEKVIYKVENRK